MSHILWINLEQKNIHDKWNLSQVAYESNCGWNFAKLLSNGKVQF